MPSTGTQSISCHVEYFRGKVSRIKRDVLKIMTVSQPQHNSHLHQINHATPKENNNSTLIIASFSQSAPIIHCSKTQDFHICF